MAILIPRREEPVILPNGNINPVWYNYFQSLQAELDVSGAPDNASYITRTPEGDLSAETALSQLNSGFMKSTTETGTITTQSQIATEDIENAAITTVLIADNAVTAAKIVDGTITADELASNSVTSAKIVDGTIATADLADDSVTLVKIQNISSDVLLGRDTALTGIIEEITLDDTLEFTGAAVLQRAALTGDCTATAGSNTTVVEKINGATLGTTTATDKNILIADGTNWESKAVSGDVTITNLGAVTIAADAVSDTKLRNSGALSVIGRSANSTGDPADISATATSGAVLREASSILGFGTIATAGIADAAVTYAKIQDVSATDKVLGRSTAGSGDVEEIACTSAGRALLDDADATAQRATLGLGTIATQDSNAVSITGGSGSGLTSWDVDNIKLDGNTVSSTNANGNLILAPNGTGDVSITTASIQLADGEAIKDSSGNELIVFQLTASAVNQFDITNAATTTNPTLEATGGDTNVGIDFLTKAAGTFNFKGNATQAATLKLYEDTTDGTNSVAIKAPTLAADYTLTLPVDDGTSGQFLKTDGVGVLSWDTVSANAGGTDTQVQFNDGGTALGGDAGLVYNKTTNVLTCDTQITIGGNATAAGIIKILEDTDAGTSGVSITVPALAADYTLTLPVDDGTADQVLTTDGSGGLSWETAGGGNWVKISTTTASASATVDFIGLSSTYSTYAVTINNSIPANDGTEFWLRYSTDNGSTFLATLYDWNSVGASAAGALQDDSGSDVAITLTGDAAGTNTHSSAASMGVSGIIYIHNPSATAHTYAQGELVHENDQDNLVITSIGGKHTTTTAVDAIRFMYSGGNIASGVYTLYGLTA